MRRHSKNACGRTSEEGPQCVSRSLSHSLPENTDVPAMFEKSREDGVKALRALYAENVRGEVNFFVEHASLVDLMLLYEVFQTWGGFNSAGEESTLAGAMYELFEQSKKEKEDHATAKRK